MRTHQLTKSPKLYRSVNTTTRHHSNNPGAKYRWERNRKKVGDELLTKRETMHSRQKRGRDYKRRDLVCIGESSFYPGLFVDENGILRQVNPSITRKDVKVTCRCCTRTYIDEPVPWIE
jgi:hypothetical protein